MEISIGDSVHVVQSTGGACTAGHVLGPKPKRMRYDDNLGREVEVTEDETGLGEISISTGTGRGSGVYPHLVGKQIASTWHTPEECTQPKITIPN